MNKICNNCSGFYEFVDINKEKHYKCLHKDLFIRPSGTCEQWNQKQLEQIVEQTETGVSSTIRVWNPRSKRHEDVKMN